MGIKLCGLSIPLPIHHLNCRSLPRGASWRSQMKRIKIIGRDPSPCSLVDQGLSLFLLIFLREGIKAYRLIWWTQGQKCLVCVLGDYLLCRCLLPIFFKLSLSAMRAKTMSVLFIIVSSEQCLHSKLFYIA